jgi:hypothetical protein
VRLLLVGGRRLVALDGALGRLRHVVRGRFRDPDHLVLVRRGCREGVGLILVRLVPLLLQILLFGILAQELALVLMT